MDQNEQPEQPGGGFVVRQKTEDGAATVIVLPDGVHVYRIPGGITEDDLLD